MTKLSAKFMASPHVHEPAKMTNAQLRYAIKNATDLCEYYENLRDDHMVDHFSHKIWYYARELRARRQAASVARTN